MADTEARMEELTKGFVKYIVYIFIAIGFFIWLATLVAGTTTGFSASNALILIVPLFFVIAVVAIMYRKHIVGKGE